MSDPRAETIQTLLDRLASARIGRRDFLGLLASEALAPSSSAAYETGSGAGSEPTHPEKGARAEYDYLMVERVPRCVIAARLPYGRRGLLLEAGVMLRFRQSKPPGFGSRI